MTTDTEGRIDGEGFYATWRRNDRAWGHGIDVKLFDLGGIRIGGISFVCHPEFADFERYQAMTTEELVAVAIDRLRAVMHDGSYAKAWSHGLHLYLRFNSSEQRVS